jgi:hypothetical protein
MQKRRDIREVVHFLGQPAKIGSSMRMTHHEDAETVSV